MTSICQWRKEAQTFFFVIVTRLQSVDGWNMSTEIFTSSKLTGCGDWGGPVDGKELRSAALAT